METIKFTGDNEGNDEGDDTEERQFICEICSVITKSKINLRRHKQRFHEDDRTYTCDTESCNKTIIGLRKLRNKARKRKNEFNINEIF